MSAKMWSVVISHWSVVVCGIQADPIMGLTEVTTDTTDRNDRPVVVSGIDRGSHKG